MSLFVEVDDMPAALRGGASDDDTEAALLWACEAVESYCERRFAYVADDTVTVHPFPDRSALLPSPPVTDVSLVEGWMPQQNSMQWVELSNYGFTDEGLIYDTTGLPGTEPPACGQSWPRLPKSLRVTYSHGFDPIPDAVQAAVFKAAGLYLTNPTGLVFKQVDDVAYRWAEGSGGADSGSGGGFYGALLGRYKLVSIA